MQKRVQLIIAGRVQGVFFRARAQEKARELGLTGWVRNEPDGTVKIVAEGEENDLQRLIGWVYNKKGRSRFFDFGRPEVEKVEIVWQNYQREFSSFEIKR